MQRIGSLQLQKSEDTVEVFQFVWSETAPTFERVDIFQDVNSYNMVDTSTCVVSYIRKKQEMILGDNKVLNALMRIKTTVVNCYSETTKDVFVEDGVVTLKMVKEDEAQGVYYEMLMKNGSVVSEIYKSDEGVIVISAYNNTDDSSFEPINIGAYKTYSVIENYSPDSGQGSIIHSYEWLMTHFPSLQNLLKEDYVIVEDYETYEARLNEFKNSPYPLRTVDVETTGLDVNYKGVDCITGVVLSYGPHNSTYYPFRQDEFEYNLPIECLRNIFDVIRDLPRNVLVLAHNALMELKSFKHDVGDFVRVDVDTMLLSILQNPIIRRGLHGLKPLAEKYTGQKFIELSDIFIGEIKFNKLPKEIVKIYACPDGPNPIIVYNELMKLLPKDEINLSKLEYRLVKVKAYNEYYGLRANMNRLQKLTQVEEGKVTLLRDLFQKIHNTSANINSPDVKREIIYNRLRCPVHVRTKTGQPSTSVVAIDDIVSRGRLKEWDEASVPPPIRDKDGKVIIKGQELASNRYPSLVILQKYSKANKELSALKRIKNHCHGDRVQFYINQAGTESGRQSSDAHQYSDTMKSIVVSDSPHHWFWSCDWKQIELRILAFLAGEKRLIEMENDPEVDIHRAITSLITGKEMWEISAKERNDKKRVNFGVVYMMSEYGLAMKEVGPNYTKEDLLRNKKAITDFFNGLPHIKAFVAGNEEFIRTNGYIKTVCGRYRYFKEILEPECDEATKRSYVRKGNNTPVQGFGADALKQVEVMLLDYIHEKGWDKEVDCDGEMLPMVRLMLSIHDEVLVSTHKSIPIEEIIIMFKECMELDIEGAPSFFAAPAMVTNWLDGKDDAYEIPLLFRDKVIEEWTKNKNRILHTDTYFEERDEELLTELNKISTHMRTYLSEDEFVKGSVMPKQETLDKVYSELTDVQLRLYEKHLIAPYESYEGDELVKQIVTRLLDEKFTPYLHDLNEYRRSVLTNYMEGLVAKYKTPEEVTKHVRHPDLTHVLISAYVDKSQAKTMKHIDCIALAVEKYFESRQAGVDVFIDTKSDTDDEIKTQLNDFDELNNYIHFDQNGEVIIDEEVAGEEAEDVVFADKGITSFDYFRIDRTFVLYLLDKVVIDLSGIKLDERADKVQQELLKLASDEEFYECYYMSGEKVVRAGFKLPYKPVEVEEICRKYLLTNDKAV